jgi:hypothetical protein
MDSVYLFKRNQIMLQCVTRQNKIDTILGNNKIIYKVLPGPAYLHMALFPKKKKKKST